MSFISGKYLVQIGFGTVKFHAKNTVRKVFQVLSLNEFQLNLVTPKNENSDASRLESWVLAPATY
jgi:hypothetical protein